MTYNFKHLVRLGDHPRIMAFVLSSFSDELDAGNYPKGRRVPSGDEQCWIVLDESSEPIAFATHYVPDTTGMMWLDLLYVHWAHRREGIGAELLALVEAKAREQGCNRAEWGTGVGNGQMNALSHREGAEHVGNIYRKPLPPYSEGAA